MTPDLVPLEVWADEGRRSAPQLTDVAAAVVVGRDAEAAAAVAIGLAKACAGERRVAVADLIGGVPALTPLDDQPGLLECLRDGTPVSEIGQPLGDAPDVYLLPAGRGPIAERWVFESARWERLVGGFREVHALLLLVAQAGAPGLERLIERVDGVVAVDLPPAVLRSYPLLATIDHPEPELPPIPGTPAPGSLPAVPPPPRRRLRGRFILAAALALLAAGIGLRGQIGTLASRVAQSLGGGASTADSLTALAGDSLGGTLGGTLGGAEAAGSVGPADSLAATTADSLAALGFTLGPVVNPDDSAAALRFSVELVAANSLSGANSGLTSRGNPYPIPIVAPVLLGSAPTVWYRAMVGAWATKAEAEAWLERQRALGLVRSNVGRVVEAPFALQLFEGPREEALVQTAQLDPEDVRVYVLETTDGRVRLMAGAFESASQALWFAAQLHGRGLMPQLAYRTGRTF